MSAATPEEHGISEEVLESLRAMSRDIAEAENNPFQPRCIAAAFAEVPSRFVLTMQVWINLAHSRSPLLLGRVPETIGELEDALTDFHYSGPTELDPEEMAQAAEEMLGAVNFGFSTVLAMEPEEGKEDRSTAEDGFGSWAPILAALVTQLGLAVREALSLPVAQVYVLLASHRRNQGWRPAGTHYALRDLGANVKQEEVP